MALNGMSLCCIKEERASGSETLKHYSGVSTKVQLWQFLLELLYDTTTSNIITWEGDYGEFRMISPEQVAKRWGDKSGRRKMTYETMSRALRHYYSKGILSKVKHKKWCYRFSCDALEGAARSLSCSGGLPAVAEMSSTISEYCKTPSAYDDYINAAPYSLQVPKMAMYPNGNFYLHSSMTWPFIPSCFINYGSYSPNVYY